MNEILSFRSATEFREWLAANHKQSDGIWLRIFKNSSGQPTVTYTQALDEALCFGWIDGQKQRGDELSWLQKVTPRRARSVWSKINKDRALRLIEDGSMETAGMAAIEAAQNDGRWDCAYDSSRNSTVPEDLLTVIRQNSDTLAFFESLNKINKYAIAYRLQSARTPALRQKRMETILAMLARREAFH